MNYRTKNKLELALWTTAFVAVLLSATNSLKTMTTDPVNADFWWALLSFALAIYAVSKVRHHWERV